MRKAKRKKLKLKSLHVKNFRSVANLTIHFGSRITCITGESYAGKSNIVRCLRLVARNSPAGTTYIRRNTKQTNITLNTTRGTIKRIRGKTTNTYQVNDQIYHSFGKDVPTPVRKVINLSDTNFQLQQEVPHGAGPLFWFALKPKEVLSEINKIVNLSQIDSIIKFLAKRLGTAKTTARVLKKKREDAWDKLKDLQDIPQMKDEWDRVESSLKKLDSISNTIFDLSHTLLDIRTRQLHISRFSTSVEKMVRDLEKVIKAKDKADSIDAEVTILNLYIKDTKQKKQQIDKLKQQYNELVEELGNICPECGRPYEI